MSDIDANTIVPREIMAELRAKQGKGRIYDIDSLFSNFSPAQAVSALATMFWDCPEEFASDALSAKCFHTKEKPCAPEQGSLAIYYYRMGIGGGERVTRDLIKLWRSIGFRVSLITDFPPEETDYDLPTDVPRFTLPPFDTIGGNEYGTRAEALESIIKEQNITHVVYGQWLSPLLLWDELVIKACGCRLTIYTHGMFGMIFSETDSSFCNLPAAYQLADSVVCLDKASAAFWSNFNKNVFVTINPNPFDLNKIAPASLEEKTVLWLGRFSAYDKCPFEAILIMQEVAALDKDVRLLMVGPCDDDYRAFLEREISARDLNDNIALCGPQQNVFDYYRESSVFLMTSKFEGYPLTLAESKAAGVPCVMYALPYLTLAEQERGITSVPFGDRKGAAQEIIRLIHDTAYRKSMGRDARCHIEKIASFDFRTFWLDVLHGQSDESHVYDKKYHIMAWEIALSYTKGRIEATNREIDQLIQHQTELHTYTEAIETASSQSNAVITEQAERIKELEETLQSTSRELEEILQSKTFRLGSTLMYIPSKIKSASKH